MNFRLLWMATDDDPYGDSFRQATAVPHRSVTQLYEQRGNELVRCEPLASRRVRVPPLANFCARVVRDLILDDDAELQREFSCRKVATITGDIAGEYSQTPNGSVCANVEM